ncbi:unnamed protein product, partial [Ectocarpus sp. 12 AP-2014]
LSLYRSLSSSFRLFHERLVASVRSWRAHRRSVDQGGRPRSQLHSAVGHVRGVVGGSCRLFFRFVQGGIASPPSARLEPTFSRKGFIHTACYYRAPPSPAGLLPSTRRCSHSPAAQLNTSTYTHFFFYRH